MQGNDDFDPFIEVDFSNIKHHPKAFFGWSKARLQAEPALKGDSKEWSAPADRRRVPADPEGYGGQGRSLVVGIEGVFELRAYTGFTLDYGKDGTVISESLKPLPELTFVVAPGDAVTIPAYCGFDAWPIEDGSNASYEVFLADDESEYKPSISPRECISMGLTELLCTLGDDRVLLRGNLSELRETLNDKQIPFDEIRGDMSSDQREGSFARFSLGGSTVLCVADDVSSEGALVMNAHLINVGAAISADRPIRIGVIGRRSYEIYNLDTWQNW